MNFKGNQALMQFARFPFFFAKITQTSAKGNFLRGFIL